MAPPPTAQKGKASGCILAAQTQPLTPSSVAASPAIQTPLPEVRQTQPGILLVREMPRVDEGISAGIDEETEEEIKWLARLIIPDVISSTV